ncbi:DUF4160 domain-containing protein [Massilia sp. R2A-15]|uniref:DUF4160 domain-containing protein n=1 Tax=Massilia sp. R2A-15 TaxID=3064278 RepID=UPI0035A60091
MPTVVTLLGFRLVIYPGDHPPAHVHVIGKGVEAVFKLNCPNGPSILRNQYRFPGKELVRISPEIDTRILQLCEVWRSVNGNF